MVHQKVLEAYKEADYDYYKTAHDYNEEAFFEQANGAKSPIKREIIKVVRIKVGPKEHFYYHEELKSKNFLGNSIHLYRVGGKYDLPVFKKEIDTKTNQAKVVEIEYTEPVYELEWNKDWSPEIEQDCIDKTDFMITTTSRKYGGFDLYTFLENKFDSLVTLGRFGTLNPELIEKEKTRQSRRK